MEIKMRERWKQIDNSCYYVSSFGRFYSTSSKKILKQNIDKDGYNIITLLHKTYRSHRLVAKNFLNNVENLPQVNHKDGNKQNNNISNLEWCDQSYNMRHRFEVLKQVPYNKNKKMSQEFCEKMRKALKGRRSLGDNGRAKAVICIETGIIYSCAREAENTIKVSKGSIAHCAKGYSKTSGGYHWEYV